MGDAINSIRYAFSLLRTYVLTVTDSLLCKDSMVVNITQPDSIYLVTEAKDLKCYNDNSGK